MRPETSKAMIRWSSSITPWRPGGAEVAGAQELTTTRKPAKMGVREFFIIRLIIVHGAPEATRKRSQGTDRDPPLRFEFLGGRPQSELSATRG